MTDVDCDLSGDPHCHGGSCRVADMERPMNETLKWSDFPRLARLLDRVERYTSNGHWVTLTELSQACGGTEASVSARLRDLRKRGAIVDRRQIRPGLWEYRVH